MNERPVAAPASIRHAPIGSSLRTGPQAAGMPRVGPQVQRPPAVAVGRPAVTLRSAQGPAAHPGQSRANTRADAHRRLPGLKRKIGVASAVAFAGLIGLAASNAVGVTHTGTPVNGTGTSSNTAGGAGQGSSGSVLNSGTSQNGTFFDPAGGNPGLTGGASNQGPVFQSSGS